MAKSNKKDSFSVQFKWFNSLNQLGSVDSAWRIILALKDAAETLATPEETYWQEFGEKAVFMTMVDDVITERKAYLAKCERNKLNGHLGGRPKE